MTSGQGYIETQNPAALRSLVVGRRTPGKDTTKMYGGGNSRPAERYATYSEVYGPYREDSMELKEETAYQRGMMEHIRENMDSINKLNAELSDSNFPRGYQQGNETPFSPVSPPAESFYPHRGVMDTSERTHHGDFQGNMANTTGEYNERYLADGFPGPYKPKPAVTYTELGQNSSRKLPPPLARTYTEMFLAPRTHSKIRITDVENGKKASSDNVMYLQRTPRSPKFGMSSLPPNGWTAANTRLPPEELWDQRSHGLGKFTDRNENDLSTSRIPYMPGSHTLPLATVRLPALSNAQSLPSLHTIDRYQGNVNPGKLNIDINLKMLSQRDDDYVYGQNKYGSETWHGNISHNNAESQMAINSLTPLGRPPILYNSQSSVPPQYQPFSNRNNGQVDQQIVDATQGSTIYPYRQMNNPWFPPLDELPAFRKNMRRGKYGHYRVFDIHDYKKLQKELRLGSLVGEQKDVETIQEKKEKRAILQEYGRLVRAKNREEMRPPLPL